MTFLTGWGQHSRPGNQGLATVQVNMLVRLFFGCGQIPSGSYHLDVRDMTNPGRLMIEIAEKTASGVSHFHVKF